MVHGSYCILIAAKRGLKIEIKTCAAHFINTTSIFPSYCHSYKKNQWKQLATPNSNSYILGKGCFGAQETG